MSRDLVLEFSKMHGAGNDFIVIDNRFFHFSDAELAALAGRLCRRRYAVGADGLLALAPPVSAETAFRMRYFNADGSLGSMCGNGARCLVRFAVEAGIEGPHLAFDSDDGVYRAEIDPATPDRVRLHLPDPRAYSPTVPVQELPLREAVGSVASIWTGVPHAVCRVSSVDEAPVVRLGSALRNDPAFPEGANVNFVQVGEAGEDEVLKVRTFERGVEAETLACGTGAVASAISAWMAGWVASPPIRVQMPGGELTVGWVPVDGRATRVTLEGPVVFVYRGTVPV